MVLVAVLGQAWANYETANYIFPPMRWVTQTIYLSRFWVVVGGSCGGGSLVLAPWPILEPIVASPVKKKKTTIGGQMSIFKKVASQ